MAQVAILKVGEVVRYPLYEVRMEEGSPVGWEVWLQDWEGAAWTKMMQFDDQGAGMDCAQMRATAYRGSWRMGEGLSADPWSAGGGEGE